MEGNDSGLAMSLGRYRPKDLEHYKSSYRSYQTFRGSLSSCHSSGVILTNCSVTESHGLPSGACKSRIDFALNHVFDAGLRIDGFVDTQGA